MQAGERVERISYVALPEWEIRSELDLMQSPTFGVTAATAALHHLIGEGYSASQQLSLATFDRYGFKAASISGLIMELGALSLPENGIERTASLRFDHPFAAIAVIGQPRWPAPDQSPARFRGLPVFEAWVHTPVAASTENPYPDWLGELLLAALPDREKLVMDLYYYEGLALAEIAEALEITKSHAEQALTSAVTQLRTILGSDVG